MPTPVEHARAQFVALPGAAQREVVRRMAEVIDRRRHDHDQAGDA